MPWVHMCAAVVICAKCTEKFSPPFFGSVQTPEMYCFFTSRNVAYGWLFIYFLMKETSKLMSGRRSQGMSQLVFRLDRCCTLYLRVDGQVDCSTESFLSPPPTCPGDQLVFYCSALTPAVVQVAVLSGQ